MMSIILGLIMIVAGAMMAIKAEWLLENFGRIGWFEEHLGTDGGSRLGYKLIGILLFFLGVLSVTGLIGGFMNWVLSPLTKYSSME